MMNNKLLLALRAEKSNVEIHQHSAFQIVITADNFFHTTIEKKKHKNIFGFAIKPNVAHSCECSQSNVIILNIEPLSFFGKYIAEKLGTSDTAVFFDQNGFREFFNDREDHFSICNLLNSGNENHKTQETDKRIQQAISFINTHFASGHISTQDIAAHVFLSPSRLAALFKQQTGSSISKYLLWTRLRNAIFQILTENNKTLTSIALESGFYDSSQMNKYMYQMFGVSPSKLKQKSNLIQFLDLETN